MPGHAVRSRDIDPLVTINALVFLECVDTVFATCRDTIGGDRTGREDDEKTLAAEKLNTYNGRTAPLIEHYTLAKKNSAE